MEKLTKIEKISSFKIVCALTFALILLVFAGFVACSNPTDYSVGCFITGRSQQITTYSVGDYYTCEEVREMILLDIFPYDIAKEKIEYFCKGEIKDIDYYNFYVSDYISYYREECLK